MFRSYSWSFNVCGRKKWILFPPAEACKLFDAHGNLLEDIRCVDHKRFPLFKHARCVEVIQQEGEAIFIPSNYYHQVHNLEDTLSINHNWANAANIQFIWNYLVDDLLKIRTAISDCYSGNLREWETICQTVLLANAGMDFSQFFELIQFKSERLIHEIEDPSADDGMKNLACFSLTRCFWIVQDMMKEQFIQRVFIPDGHDLTHLALRIEGIVNDYLQSVGLPKLGPLSEI